MNKPTILFFLFIAFFSCKKENKNPIKDTDTTTEEIANFKVTDGTYCFVSAIENKVIKDKDTIIEKDFLRVQLTIDGKNATGQYSFSPSNKNDSKGAFTGTIDTKNIITSIYTYTQKNKEAKEEIIFKLDENQISLLGGEKEERDGIFYFKDKSQGIYMIQIPKVNCE